MGGAQSSENGHYGFHVLKVKKNSPAFSAGIEQFFDYIISIQGTPLNGDGSVLVQLLKNNQDTPIRMGIYSSKNQAVREITLTPSDTWHQDVNEKSLIGCSIRYCSYERAGENVWHVLDIALNSPAEMAGIIPHSDYIIGSPHTVLKSEDDFYQLVEGYSGKPLRLYLYNTQWDSCREVIIIPSHEWGGAGSLGCDVGYGLLHRIPRKQPVSSEAAEAEAEDDSDQEESGLFFQQKNKKDTLSNMSFLHSQDKLSPPLGPVQQKVHAEQNTPTSVLTVDTHPSVLNPSHLSKVENQKEAPVPSTEAQKDDKEDKVAESNNPHHHQENS